MKDTLQLQDFLSEVQEFFVLDSPVILKIIKSKAFSGMWEERYDDEAEKYHYIRISTIFNEKMEEKLSTLLHELIHAEQDSKGRVANHDVYFWRRAHQLEKIFADRLNGAKIADRDLDKDN